MLSTWSFGRVGHAASWPALAAGGDSLDAVEAACRAVEADPGVESVGLGGLPDAAGAVTLDGAVMLSPARCGAVCALSRHLHAVSVARRVMEATPHVTLAGAGADAFAEAQGFAPRTLLTDGARAEWAAWRRDPGARDQRRAPRPVGEPRRDHDTLGVLAIDRRGVLSGACTTSGTAFKLPGRVGDSALIGQGLYVDPGAGGAVFTGWGELITGVCGAFLAVERLRAGAPPVEAVRAVLERILGSGRVRADTQVAGIAVTPDGAWGSASLRAGFRAAVRADGVDRLAAPGWIWQPGVIVPE